MEVACGHVAAAVAQFNMPETGNQASTPEWQSPISAFSVEEDSDLETSSPAMTSGSSTPQSPQMVTSPPPCLPMGRKLVDEVQLLSCHRSNWRYEVPYSGSRWHHQHQSGLKVPASQQSCPSSELRQQRRGPAINLPQVTNQLNSEEEKCPVQEQQHGQDEVDMATFPHELHDTEDGPYLLKKKVNGEASGFEETLECKGDIKVQQNEGLFQGKKEAMPIPVTLVGPSSPAIPDSDASLADPCNPEQPIETVNGHAEASVASEGCNDLCLANGGASVAPCLGVSFHDGPANARFLTQQSEDERTEEKENDGTHDIHSAERMDAACDEEQNSTVLPMDTIDGVKAIANPSLDLAADTRIPPFCYSQETGTQTVNACGTDIATGTDGLSEWLGFENVASSSNANLQQPYDALKPSQESLKEVLWECLGSAQDWEERGRQCISNLEDMQRQLLVDRMLETLRPCLPGRPRSRVLLWEQVQVLELQQKLAASHKALEDTQHQLEEERSIRKCAEQQLAEQQGSITTLQKEVKYFSESLFVERRKSDMHLRRIRELEAKLTTLQTVEATGNHTMLTSSQPSRRRVTFVDQLPDQLSAEDVSTLNAEDPPDAQMVSPQTFPSTEPTTEMPGVSCDTSSSSSSSCCPSSSSSSLAHLGSNTIDACVPKLSPVSTAASAAAPLEPSYQGYGLVLGLEQCLRASIENQERDLKEWLVHSWVAIRFHSQLESLQAEEHKARRSIAQHAAENNPLAPHKAQHFLRTLLGFRRHAVEKEQCDAWHHILGLWRRAVVAMPLQSHLDLLRHHTAGRNRMLQEENHEWALLIKHYEEGLLLVIQKQAQRQCAMRITEVWENQRWLPFRGWSSQLLPQDPAPFTNAHHKATTLENINAQAIQAGYSWAGPWELDVSINCGDEGWQYAVDFRATAFSPSSSIRTTVRRRKWFRQCLPTTVAPPPNPRKLPDNLSHSCVSWQEVTGRVHIYTATGLSLRVPPCYADTAVIQVGGDQCPSCFVVEQLKGHLGTFELREERSGALLAQPKKDSGSGAHLYCTVKPGKELCRLELIYTDIEGAFHIRSSTHGWFWRVDATCTSVVATPAAELATPFCIVHAT